MEMDLRHQKHNIEGDDDYEPLEEEEDECPAAALNLMVDFGGCTDPKLSGGSSSSILIQPRTMSYDDLGELDFEEDVDLLGEAAPSLFDAGALFLPTSSSLSLSLSSLFPAEPSSSAASSTSSPPEADFYSSTSTTSSSSSTSTCSSSTSDVPCEPSSPETLDRVRILLPFLSLQRRRVTVARARRLLTQLAPMAKDISRALFLMSLLTCVVLFGVNLSSFQHIVIGFLQWIRTLGMMGGVIYIIVTALSNLVFIPTTLATLAAGYMFGLWFGFLFAYAGCCLGAVIAFLLGRTLFRSWVSSLAKQYPKVALMDQAIGKKAVGWKIVLLLRLSPMLPYNVLNYVLSVTRVRFMDYFVSSVIGMFPGVAVFTYFGSLSHDLSSVFSFSSEGMKGVDGEDRSVIIYSGFLLSVVAFVLLSYFSAQAIKKELRKIEEENEENEKKDKALDQMELQLENQSIIKAREVADEVAAVGGRPVSLRQIDEALKEARSEGSLHCTGEVLVTSSFEQNRSCGMRKNLSWVDASMA